MKQEHRFFVEGVSFQQRDVSFADEKLYHQFSRVLRLHPGETITLLDNSGWEYAVRIVALEKTKMVFFLLNKKQSNTEPVVILHLYQSLLKKKEKFEWVLQKGTEVGVSSFTPLRTEHCEFQGKLDMHRCHTILTEAAEQSHRGKIPAMNGERFFSDALKEAQGEKIVFDPLGGNMHSILSARKSGSIYSIFIGPEGGFSEKELTVAQQQGAVIFSAGPRILRSETAGMFFPGLIVQLLENGGM